MDARISHMIKEQSGAVYVEVEDGGKKYEVEINWFSYNEGAGIIYDADSIKICIDGDCQKRNEEGEFNFIPYEQVAKDPTLKKVEDTALALFERKYAPTHYIARKAHELADKIRHDAENYVGKYDSDESLFYHLREKLHKLPEKDVYVRTAWAVISGEAGNLADLVDTLLAPVSEEDKQVLILASTLF